MAALTETARAQLHRLFSRNLPGVAAATKAQLRAAVDAADDWADANQASYVSAINTALVAAGGSAASMTGVQKAAVLVLVILKRSGFSRWSIADGDE